MVLQNDIDMLNPPAELKKLKHKKKRLVQSPNSFFMDVKCQGCFNIEALAGTRARGKTRADDFRIGQDSLENVHQGYPKETLLRFLKAREWNISKAHKMLVDSLNWRIQNEIDSVLEDLHPTVVDVRELQRHSDYIGYQEGTFIQRLLQKMGFDKGRMRGCNTSQ